MSRRKGPGQASARPTHTASERVTPRMDDSRPHHPSTARPVTSNFRVLRQRPAHTGTGERQFVHPTSRRIQVGEP